MTSTVVVTGMGVISPFGRGVAALWEGLRAGRAAIGPITVFDTSAHRTQIAGQVPEGEDSDDLRSMAPRARARLTRAERFALEAAFEAVRAAGLDPRAIPEGAGVFFGSSAGGMLEAESYYRDLRGPYTRGLRASRLAGQPNCSPGEAVARVLASGGPIETVVTACSAATMAIESALDALRSGEVELAITGGSDALCELTYGGFNSLRAVAPDACRPFRVDREGLSLGEGAGVVVLEHEDAARARGARPLAVLAGAASSCDAHHMTAPDPEARGAALAITRAIEDAAIAPEAIAFVNAHGTGTPHNDASEWRAFESVFGAHASELPVTATKGSVGHLLGACGAVELVATVCGLREGVAPPTPDTGAIDPECPVDLVLRAPRALGGGRAALSLNLAFGGANAALVVRAVDDDEQERRV